MLKRLTLIGVALALLVSVGLGAVWMWGQFASPVEAQASDETSDLNPNQTITVVGLGMVRIEPDIARVSIGVETSGETIAQAVEENGAKMQAIMAALKGAGIASKDMQTMNYSVHMDRYPEPMPRAIEAESGEVEPQYRVSNTVNVVIRDLDSVSTVLDAVVDAGANSIWGVSFDLEDPGTAQDEARSKAVSDAETRAQALAELNGVQLGPVMSISEVVGGGAFPVPVSAERAVASGAGPISPGELEISFQVQVTYFIQR